MSWQPTYPSGNSKIKQIPGYLNDNFSAINSGFEAEHYSFSSASSGGHVPGVVGVLYKGPTTEISALTSPGSGSLAYDTTLGILARYTGAVWEHVSASKWSRCRYYLNANSYVVTGGQTTTIKFDEVNYDTLSEYDVATGKFTVLEGGWYIITTSIAISGNSAPASGWWPSISLVTNGTIYSNGMDQVYHNFKTNQSAPFTIYPTVSINSYICKVVAGTYIYVRLGNDYSLPANIATISGSTLSYFAAHRIPMQCV